MSQHDENPKGSRSATMAKPDLVETRKGARGKKGQKQKKRETMTEIPSQARHLKTVVPRAAKGPPTPHGPLKEKGWRKVILNSYCCFQRQTSTGSFRITARDTGISLGIEMSSRSISALFKARKQQNS